LGCLAEWREADSHAKLVDSVLSGFENDGMSNRGDYWILKKSDNLETKLSDYLSPKFLSDGTLIFNLHNHR